jgi:hypothetical protein
VIGPKPEEHIGDGVYVACDGHHIWLSTEREDGWHEIALSKFELDRLNAYRNRIVAKWKDVQDD